MKRKRKQLNLLAIIGLLLGLVWLVPFYLMIVNAFKTKKGIFTNVLGLPEEWTFGNFSQAFIELDFIRSFFNSLLITVLSTGFIIVFASMAGYALSRNKSKLSSIIFFLCIAFIIICII